MKMAGGGVEGAGFWLPAEFLADDDFLMDKENFKTSNNTEPDSEFCFPTEFPYDFQNHSDKLLELQKFWMMSTSPQSTLAHLGSAGGSSNGSPNGVPSPPLGAKYDAVGDLIYLAAGQVAKLKLNRDYVEKSPLVPTRSHAQFYPEPKTQIPSVYVNTHFQQKPQNEGCRMLYGPQQVYQNRGGVPGGGMVPAAWTPRQNPTRGMAGLSDGSRGGTAGKGACAGTGVFLPRRYENISNSNAYSSDSQRRAGRAAVQLHAHGFAQSQPQPQARINSGLSSNYYSLMARRHSSVLQQRRRLLLASLAEGSAMMGHDLYLPHEWSY